MNEALNIIEKINSVITSNKLSGVYLATPTGKLMESDKSWIQIKLFGLTRYAKPSFPFGWTFVPSEEWLTEHANKIMIWVSFEQGNPRYPVWLGVAPMDDVIPEGNYPNIATFNTTEFSQVFDDTEKLYELKHKDGSSFKLQENFVALLSKSGQGLKADDSKTSLGKKGEEKKSATRYEELAAVFNDMLDIITKMQTISPVGNNSTGALDPATTTRVNAIKEKIKTIKSNSVVLD